MGELIPFPRPYQGTVSKRQLARILNRSTRWVELRMREGLPHEHDERGYARFDPAEAQRWVREVYYAREARTA